MMFNLTNRDRPTSTIRARLLATSLCVVLLGSSGAALGHKAVQRVSGDYELLFIQFDFLGAAGSHGYINVELDGAFRLDIDGQTRHGRLVWPHVLKAPPPNSDALGSIFGGSVWIFDDGAICSGSHGVRNGTQPVITQARLRCSDGARFQLELTDQVVVPGVSLSGVIEGVSKTRHGRWDDNDD